MTRIILLFSVIFACILTSTSTTDLFEEFKFRSITSMPSIQQQTLTDASTQQIIRACNRIQDSRLRQACLNQAKK